jgi:hypothetical protein
VYGSQISSVVRSASSLSLLSCTVCVDTIALLPPETVVSPMSDAITLVVFFLGLCLTSW